MATERRTIAPVIGIALALLLLLTARAADAGKAGLVPAAVAFVHTLAQGDCTAAEADFTGQMKQAAPPDALGRVWKRLLNQVGPFQGTGRTRTVVQGGYRTVIVKADFKTRSLGIAVTFDSDRRIAGMHFVPAP
jgi:hypothetical protein